MDGAYLGIGIGGAGRKVPDDESAIGGVEGSEEKRLMSRSDATIAIDTDSMKKMRVLVVFKLYPLDDIVLIITGFIS